MTSLEALERRASFYKGMFAEAEIAQASADGDNVQLVDLHASRHWVYPAWRGFSKLFWALRDGNMKASVPE